MLGFGPVSGSPLSDVFPNIEVISVFGTGEVGNFVPEIDISIFDVFGTGQAQGLGGFDTSVGGFLGVFGTGQVSSPSIEIDEALLSVHGTGFAGVATRVAVSDGVFGIGVAQSLPIEINVVPLGVFGTGRIHVLFVEVYSSGIVREVLNQIDAVINIYGVVREGLLTEHSGNAIIHSVSIVREVHTLNADAIINTSAVTREVVLIDNATDIKISVGNLVREVLFLPDPPSYTFVQAGSVVRELLISTTPKFDPTIVLVVT